MVLLSADTSDCTVVSLPLCDICTMYIINSDVNIFPPTPGLNSNDNGDKIPNIVSVLNRKHSQDLSGSGTGFTNSPKLETQSSLLSKSPLVSEQGSGSSSL